MLQLTDEALALIVERANAEERREAQQICGIVKMLQGAVAEGPDALGELAQIMLAFGEARVAKLKAEEALRKG